MIITSTIIITFIIIIIILLLALFHKADEVIEILQHFYSFQKPYNTTTSTLYEILVII